VPAYFASDVHLRLDRPERGRRFARWVESLEAHDTLTIVGDLCDFWFAARQRDGERMACPGLQALAAFRARGGAITILPGNHDAWLGPFYERDLGARFLPEPVALEVYDLRIHLVHGHLLGARRAWKAGMESRTFFDAFHSLPAPLAHGFDALLDWKNSHDREITNQRHIAVYRRYTARHAGDADLVVLGHIHGPLDDAVMRPRMCVLGGWHEQASYLRIDDAGAALIVEADPVAVGRSE
jgi:UDP-2,3-diacylglucosamine hydrolase